MENHNCADHANGAPCAGPHVISALPVIDLHCHIATPAVEKLVAGHPERLAEIAATAELQGPESTE